MSERCPKCNRLYKAPKNVFACMCAKPAAAGKEPSAPCRQPVFPQGDGLRTYVVSDIRRTCVRCARNGKCGRDPKTCEDVSFFPIPHFVALEFAGGKIVRSSCSEGRKVGGPPCRDDGCKHIGRAVDKMTGVSDGRLVELSLTMGKSESVPKCPNCREKWGVTALPNDRFSCRNPTCAREGVPWVFEAGSKDRPPPMRDDLMIRDKDGGCEVVKRETTKRWSGI
jgi:hypothetical protein